MASLTVNDVVTAVRDRLVEATAATWSNTQIKRWMNESLRDLARHTKILRDVTTFTTTAGTAAYTLSAAIIQVDEVWYTPGDGRIIPLTGRSPASMNNVWGSWQALSGGDVQMYSLWGTSPLLKMQLYPVPDASSKVITVNHRRLAARITEDTSVDSTVIDFPEAWVDLVKDYAEARAQRMDDQPKWKDTMGLYLSARDDMAQDADLANFTDTMNSDPSRYVGGDDGYGPW